MPLPRRKLNLPSSAPPISFCDCWAKTDANGMPGIGVQDHCLNVGIVAETLLGRLPPFLKAGLDLSHASVLAALHDVGKVSPGFQVKCQNWLQQRRVVERAIQERWASCESDHAKIGQLTIQRLLDDWRLFGWSAVIGAHHGKIKGERIAPAGIGNTGDEGWESERIKLARELIREFGGLPQHPPADEAILWFIAGLITIADWLGSDERLFPPTASLNNSQRRETAEAALETIGWKVSKLRPAMGFGDLLPGFVPNPFN